MSDDFSDWGNFSAEPATRAEPVAQGEDPFADWSNPDELSKGGRPGGKGEVTGGISWLDPVKGAAAGVVGDLAAASTGAQVAAEKMGYPTIAKGARSVSSGLHRAEKQIEESESEDFRRAQGAALIPSKDQEQLGSHPINELIAKGSGVAAPATVGYAGGVLGAIIGSAIGPEGTVGGAMAGTASAGALYGLTKGIDQAVAWTNDLTDEQLEKEAPVFGQFKKMYLAEGKTPEDASYEARVALHDGLYGIKQAALDAGTNAIAFGAGRKLLTGALGGNRLAEFALSGGALGGVSAAGDVNQQNVEDVKKGTDNLDLGQTAIAFLNGTVEGLAFHGVGEAAHKLARWRAPQEKQPVTPAGSAPPPASMDGLFKEKQAANVPPDGSAAASTGATPKGTRATTQPPPNAAAQAGEIGNTTNPPKRDQEPGTTAEAAAGAKGAAMKEVGKKRSSKKDTGVTGGVTLMADEIAPAPEAQEALNQSTSGPSDVTQLAPPKPAVDVSEIQAGVKQPDPQVFAPGEAPVTPEVNRAEEVPEAPPTLEAQLDDFMGKKRDVIRFENADDVPDDVPEGVQEYEDRNGGVWWYQGDVNLRQIRKAIKDKTENELLNLGPFNKEEVLTDVAQGGEPAAVVARNAEGTEVAAAASTDRLAGPTIEAVQEANPEATVAVEPPEAVIEGRENGTGRVEPTGRVLEAKLSPEQEAQIAQAEAEQRARLEREQAAAAQRERAQSLEKAKPGQTRRKLGKEKLALREADLKKAQRVADAHPPVDDETATAAIDRAKRILAEAEAQGAKVPGTLPDNATGAQGVLREAADLIKHINSPEAAKEGVSPERIDRFVRQDRLFRGTDEDIALAKENRRAEAAAPKGKRLEGDGQIETGKATKGGTPKIDAATEKRKVIDKKGELREVEGAKAASEVRSVQLSDAEKQAILDRLNVANKPKDAPVNDVDAKDASRVYEKAEEKDPWAAEGKPALEDRVEVSRIRRDGVGPKTQETKARVEAKTEKPAEQRLPEGWEVGSDGELRQKPKEPPPKPKVELKGNEVVGVADKSAEVGSKIKVETTKRRTITRPSKPTEARRGEQRSEETTAGVDYENFARSLKGNETGSAKTGKKIAARRVSTLRDELQNVDIRGLGPLRNFIRNRLIDIVGHVKVHIVDSEALASLTDADDAPSSGTKGLYTNHPGQGPVVSIGHAQKGRERAHTIIHEALHALSHEVLNKSAEFRGQIVKIMEALQAHLADQVIDHTSPDSPFHYAFTDVHEFLSETWGNKTVHDELDAVQLTPELAKELGIRNWRGRSLWSAAVEKFRVALRRVGINWPEERVTALEAMMKITEDIAEERQIRDALGVVDRGGEAALSRADVAREAKNRTINAAAWLREQKRKLQTTTMVSMSARRLGDNFYRLSRKVDDLYKRMTTDRNELLVQEGGLDLARDAADLAKRDPDGMRIGSEIANRAAELQVDPTPAGNNDHVFKVKDPTRGSQWWAAKKALDKNNPNNIKKQWEDFAKAHPDVAAFIERASVWGQKAKESEVREVLVSVLDRAKIYNPNLVSRILKEGKVPDADKATFKSEALIEHIDRFMEAEGRKGWYFPAMREGKHVVRAVRNFDVPKAAHISKVPGERNVVQIMDPTGGSSKLKARRAAKDFYDKHTATQIAGEPDQLHMVGRMQEVWVDKRDPTKLLDKSDINSIPAYRIRLQDEWMSKHETEAEAREEAEALRKAGWSDVKDPVIQRLNPNAKWSGFMPSQYEAVLNSLRDREKFKGMEPQKQAEMILAMHHANVKLLPGARLQHTRLPRKNVAGFDKDIASVISRYVQMSAGFRARVRNIGKIEDALSDLREDIGSHNDKRNVERWDVAHTLEDRIYRGQEFEKTPWLVGALGKASMVTKLFGPSQPIINATEPGLVTLPVLAGYHGPVKAVRALKDAYSVIGAGRVGMAGVRDMMKAWKTDHGFTDYRDFITRQIENSGADSNRVTRLSQLIDHLHDMNLFGHEAGMEIQRLEGSDVRVPFLDRADIMFRQVNQGIEAINRAVSGIAAYELQYQKNGGNHLAAMEYARDVVHDTMGDYSAANASPAFNSTFGRTAFQFKKYAQKSYGLMGKLAADAYHGDAEAKRAFIGVMLSHGAAAGALGMPGTEIVKAALLVPGMLGGYSWDDFQATVRHVAEELFGKDLGMAMTRGLPRAFGVDMAGRVGWDNLALPSRNPNSFADIKNWGYDLFAGAPGSLPLEMIRAATDLIKDDVGKAMEDQPSKFVRDLYRAAKGYSGGLQDETGRDRLKPFGAGEALVQALGFRPTRAAEVSERNQFVKSETRKLDQQRRSLINNWVNAADRDSAWGKIVEFNKTVDPDARITPKQLVSQQKRRATEERTGSYDEGMRVTKRNRSIVERAREVY